MIKNLVKGLAVLAIAVSLTTVTFTGKASAYMFIDNCRGKLLRVGSKGYCVSMLQDLMNQAHVMYIGWGYNPNWPSLELDGDFGPLTRKAVVAYQSANKAQGDPIAVDGVVGTETWNYITADCAWFWVAGGFQSIWCRDFPG